MKTTILIPCYNEKSTLHDIIEKVIKSPIQTDKEILLIDDHSTDGTKAIVEKILTRHTTPNQNMTIKAYFHNKNRGKGAAIKTGLSQATGDILIIQDADLEYDPNDYPALIDPILKGTTKVVYGSRFLNPNWTTTPYAPHTLANKGLTALSNLTTGLTLTDMETCYKAIHKDIYTNLHLKEKRFGIEPELTAKIAKLTKTVLEVPISYNPRTYNEGKKIGIKDGLRAIWCILKYA